MGGVRYSEGNLESFHRIGSQIVCPLLGGVRYSACPLFRGFTVQAESNPKAFWSHTRSILKIKCGVDQLLSTTNDKNSLKFDDQEKANILQNPILLCVYPRTGRRHTTYSKENGFKHSICERGDGVNQSYQLECQQAMWTSCHVNGRKIQLQYVGYLKEQLSNGTKSLSSI